MKKTALFILLTSLFVFKNVKVNAQDYGFKSDEFLFSSGLGISSSKTGENSNFGYRALLGCGVFVSKKSTVNMNLDIVGLVDNNSVFVELFGKTYSNPEKRLSFFGKYGISYFEKQIDKIDKVGYNILLFSPGINYFISNSISLEANFGNIGYNFEKAQAKGSLGTSKINFGIDLNRIQFGLLIKRN